MSAMIQRRALGFVCEGDALIGTLDLPAAGDATVGLLLVSGGNEIRSGAWAGQAQLAASVAAAGFAVLRFDRRGVGDSEGENLGFRGSAPDIAAAMAALRAAVPGLERVVALGNCDAASALMLACGGGADALVLSNPWTIEDSEEGASEVPAAALRAHYRARLANPAALLRLLTGKVSPLSLIRSVLAMARPKPKVLGPLAQAMTQALAGFAGPVRLLVAERDRTAQVFLSNWDARDPRIATCPGASHSFVEDHARDWLREQVLGALRER